MYCDDQLNGPGRAGQNVEQRFGDAEASNGGLLFQGHVSGPVQIYHETRAKQHVAQRIIPFPRNEDVVDRDIFAALDRLLPSSPNYQSAALWGLGGSGKTQIALEYAYRRTNDRACSVFWVHADNETTFTQDYKVIAKRLGIAGSLDGSELLAAVRERIEADPFWLFILDNADNLAMFGVGGTQSGAEEHHSLFEFIPRGPAGTVLWTSRDKRIGGSLVGARRAVHVSSMAEGEARTLLETVMCKTIDVEWQDAMSLLSELEWLPLAVSQAAAYMRRTSTPIREYLRRLRRRMKRWEIFRVTEFDRHRRHHVPNNVLETWDISIEHIRQEDRMACEILQSLAFVDSQNIPFGLIAKAAEMMGRPTRSEEHTGVNWEDEGQNNDDNILAATVLLQDFSFLRLRVSSGQYQTYEMHKLVQEAMQYSLSQEKNRKVETYFSEIALRAVIDLFPERRRELWGECERYLRHAQRAAEWATLCGLEVEAAALLSRLSDYLYDRGRWSEKEPIDETAYEYRNKVLGEKHPDTIWSMAVLATTYHAQGRYDAAEKIYVDVLALRRDVLGDKHPDTIWSMAELAATYHTQGKYDAAEKIYVDVLALRRDVLGDKHPDTIWSMAVLATTYHAQGRYDAAEKIYVDVLALRRDVLGEKHPDTIWSMASLATTYHAQGRYDEAEKIKVDVLSLRRDVLGEKHPDTIWSMASLATTYHAQGKYDAAEKIYVDVLALRRDVLGEKHPDTIRSMAELATTYHAQGRYDEAEKIKVDVLALRRTVLGDIHPDTLQATHDLAVIWNSRQQGPQALTTMQECYQL
ncbi:hypothetical protein Purlil1_12267 [Purpureocillium lilacinum]|uniref:ORC1/DEAH AAA+ ATPase domain-containing protein n=1 Tax=Purpureocillium lilacinum TaxID=33203 RepID=A0ABR0BHC7_PURLI|nr:hypothetical protein Purlil1_12267 [Purpureocillium lilacinum]